MSKEIREVSGSDVLAALAHPLRRRLMDVLKVHGACTASMMAERTGQAVANVSHHIKVLAGCDLVEEAPELARDRRERWWRLVSAGVRWSTAGATDPAGEAVAQAALALNLERQSGLARAWWTADETEKDHWGAGPFSTDHWLRLTPEELAEFERQLQALVGGWRDRAIPDDGQERESVFFFAHGVPAKP
ncbi:ArsR/SmtB family transcription factor [Actinoplanes rectilineatus]|uniref:ArsR/SmtB family transcription factor n=1 Tax=Actinoplanes rectilineatus TaxID=113571 RepID=UPI0005F2A6EC|nr:metalloregulator ArsR/SmtB family transcription factor [Actinoplanes rectilineatus]